ncbi:hypothetical protein [Clostridium sp.]|uniref:hypothetical protein n=1 Tax=Clostridium sp. TaxID=1506 RepID=UPI002FC78595
MKCRQYLLDSNIVIIIWRKYPNLFNDIEKNNYVDFIISKDIARELSQKEFKTYNGIQILSDKFLNILGHVLEEEVNVLEDKLNVNIKRNERAGVFIINDNKISTSDFNLLCICNRHEEFILVTEDKKLISSATLIFDSTRVLNFVEFIDDIKEYLYF